jgi:hypothetical protein
MSKNVLLETRWTSRTYVACEAHKDASIGYMRKAEENILRTYGFASEPIVETPTDDPCALCVEAEKEALASVERIKACREAMQHPDYMFGRHTRYGGIRIVHRDPTSPSGRIAAAWCTTEEFDQLNKELGQASRPQDIVKLGE